MAYNKTIRVILLIFLLLLTVSCAAINATGRYTEETVWTPPLVIYASVPDAKGQPVSNPSIAVDQKGAINVVWWAKGFGEIYFSRSTDGGKSFSHAINISNTPLSSDHPVVAVNSTGTIYVVWDDGSIVPFAPEILFTFSSDGGTTWSTQKNISNTTRSSSTRSNITVDSQGAISVVWLEGSGGVFFTRSTDGGGTWSVPKSVSGQNAPTMIFAPAIAVDDRGRIYVAWSVANGQTFFTRSTDEGTTFSLPKAISEGKPTLAPSLALDNRDETLYIAWSDGSSGTAGVLFAMSRDMGETFSSPVDISRSSEIPSMEPRIITDRKGTIWAIWTEFLPGNPEIFVVHSNDGGNTFSQPQNISNLPGNSWLPGISTGPAGDVDVVWEQGMKEAILFSKLAKH